MLMELHVFSYPYSLGCSLVKINLQLMIATSSLKSKHWSLFEDDVVDTVLTE